MLIKDDGELKNILSTSQKNIKIETFAPYIRMCERTYILPLLGAAQLAALDAAYNANTMSLPQTNLLACLHPALGHYTLYHIMPFLNIGISEQGLVQTSSEHANTARIADVQEAKREALKLADNCAEAVLVFLEENLLDFPLWVASSSYTLNYELLINSGTDLGEYLAITNSSRRAYLRLVPEIRNCERLYITKYISAPLLSQIKSQVKNNNLSLLNDTLLEVIKPALAYITIWEALPSLTSLITPEGFISFSAVELTAKEKMLATQQITFLREKFEKNADTYLLDLKSYLDTNAALYPLYFNSGIYVPPPTIFEKKANDIGNNENSSLFYV